MPPTPINFNGVQPFKAVRDNWYSVKPYYDNYINTISIATIFMTFLGSLSLVIKHGFTFPRVHPMMVDVEDLEPSREHANEFLKEKDLLEVKIWELEDELELRVAKAEAWSEREIDTT